MIEIDFLSINKINGKLLFRFNADGITYDINIATEKNSWKFEDLTAIAENKINIS